MARRLVAAEIAPGAVPPPACRKAAVPERWIDNRTRVVVATVAFGMGIDKADVRFVVNYSIPQTLADFYQTCGRAGRDGARRIGWCTGDRELSALCGSS